MISGRKTTTTSGASVGQAAAQRVGVGAAAVVDEGRLEAARGATGRTRRSTRLPDERDARHYPSRLRAARAAAPHPAQPGRAAARPATLAQRDAAAGRPRRPGCA